MYATLKNLHVVLAVLSIGGFLLRALWMIVESPRLKRRITRILPHIIDAAFLITGIALVFVLRLQVTQNPWLLAKLTALVAYVVLGSIALRRGRTKSIRITALILAMLALAYVVGAAISKSAASWLVY